MFDGAVVLVDVRIQMPIVALLGPQVVTAGLPGSVATSPLLKLTHCPLRTRASDVPAPIKQAIVTPAQVRSSARVGLAVQDAIFISSPPGCSYLEKVPSVANAVTTYMR
jgi:hypothetical protein